MVTISPGTGFWDVTSDAYGMKFSRAPRDGSSPLQVVEIIGPAGSLPNREREVRLSDGRRIVVELMYLRIEES